MPFLSVPISPKFPEELKLPVTENELSSYVAVNVPEFVASHISPAQFNGLSGSSLAGLILRALPDFE